MQYYGLNIIKAYLCDDFMSLIKLISNFFKYLNIYQCVNNNVYCDLHYLIELLEELFFYLHSVYFNFF